MVTQAISHVFLKPEASLLWPESLEPSQRCRVLLLENNFDEYVSPISRSTKWCLLIWFFNSNLFSLVAFCMCVPHVAQWFMTLVVHIIGCSKIMNVFITKSATLLCYSVPPYFQVSLSTLCFKTEQYYYVRNNTQRYDVLPSART